MYAPVQDVPHNLRQILLPMKNTATTVILSQVNFLWNDKASAARYEVRPTKLPTWLTGTASTIMAADALLRWIEDLYIVSDRRAVREFLRMHPDLAGMLIEAYEPLADAFGPFPRVSLSIMRDPEIEDKVELLGSILTPLGAAEALARLEQFDDRWFLHQLKQASGLLNFDLEFV